MTKRERYLRRVCEAQGVPFDPAWSPREQGAMLLKLGGGPLTRADYRRVACPRCEAPAGEACRHPDGTPRPRHHIERKAPALKALRPWL